ncbi:MAG: PQQ-dependent sugar dehydrogenase [Chitinophagaceae bacterium]|nr:PQQ-dependent sugar dehydrogenase [Chitinophagaceae bacterium]
MKKGFTSFVLFFVLFVTGSGLLPLASFAQTFPAGFSTITIGSGWSEPVGAAFNKTATRLFVWEKGGKVYVCNLNAGAYVKQTTPVLDLSAEVGNWRDHGLLGFALDPNFETNGLIYLLYVVDRHHLLYYGTGSYNATTNTYLAATIGRITRYKTITSGGNLVADPTTRTILLGETKSTGIPILHESHGIGSLAFAADGTLLASAGDAASYNTTDVGNLAETYYAQALTDGIIRANENVGAFRSQMINSYNGKLLRINPTNGNGVSSNPYYDAASPRSAKSRVWAMGFRNPYRFCVRPNTGSTNPATGDIGEIYVGDVGWNNYEELNIIKAPASNCGWPIFEGFNYLNSYASATTANKDEPNPRYGLGGCTQQYFNFQNLIKQATADNNTTLTNPCNSSYTITSPNPNRFFHRVPAVDWKHGVDSARVKKFTGNTLGVAQIGTTASGVTGTPFRGNAASGSCWYTGTMLPAAYRNTYLQADYGGAWLKNFTIQYIDQLKEVNTLGTGFIAIVCITDNPVDGSLVFVDIGTGTVKKLSYGGNQPPVVKMSSNKTFGPAPLAVNFTGNTSYDPEAGAITYSWDFGDGTALSTSANPTHTFTTANSSPKKFVVKLTVKDNLNATSTDSLIISANNTPPVVNITSPAKNSFYQLGADTAYLLRATVTDAEHPGTQLFYQWQTSLRHNNHQHSEPVDTVRNSSAVISRIGCNGDTYYWFIKLTVTDGAGLVTIDSSKIFPQCGGTLASANLESFTVTTQGNTNLVNWVTNSEINLSYFLVERSYDGVHFSSIGRVQARRAPGLGAYEWRDADHLAGYNYYRIRLVDIGEQAKFSVIARVYTGDITDNRLIISPNPVTGNSFIAGMKFSHSEKISFRISDMNGKIIAIQKEQARTGFNSFNINRPPLAGKGVYTLELITETETKNAKLIIAN